MHRHVAEPLLRDCFGYRDRETFVVVAEPETAPIAEQLASGARDRGFPAALLVMPARAGDAEPPDYVVEALRAADIALLLTPRSLGAQALKSIAGEGLRLAEIDDLPPEALWRLLDVPLAEVCSRATVLSGALEPGRRVRVRGPGGTDLTFTLSADREVRDGVIKEKGEFGRLPPGLVRVAVEPGTIQGTLVIDAWSPFGDAAARRPVLHLENGAVARVPDGGFRRELAADGSAPPVVDSIGFGLNAAAVCGRGPSETLIAAGCAFLRLRRGRTAPVDLCFAAPYVEVEGMPVPAEVLSPPPSAKSAAPPAERPAPGEAAPVPAPGDEVFRLFFENSNDPQYAIDFETQKFILVNDAFLRISGYSRSDITSGRLGTQDVTAEESRERVNEKKAQRKQVPSERYEMRLKCADGTKRPVEVSVQRLKLHGRDVVIGSLRDLTTHERMRRDLTERATDAMRKTLEIYALTEKIKNVPKLTPALLASEEEDEILAKAARILTQKPGLSYASARIYLIEEQHLVQRIPPPTSRGGPSRFDLSKNHRLARVARGEETSIDMADDEIAIALTGREGVIGVLEVTLDPKEAEVMTTQGGHTVRSEYQNLLVSIAQILALAIENNRLFQVVKEQSETDQLTGVCNRRVFDRRLGEEVQRARRYGRDLSLLMIDLDHFKHVNDNYGHPKGDETLRHIAQFLRAQSRGVDILARYGGDEFCLLLPECSLDNAVQKAEMLRKRFVTRKFSTVGRGSRCVRLTLSIGVGSLTDEMSTEFDLVRSADGALYHAKETRNRVCNSSQSRASEKLG